MSDSQHNRRLVPAGVGWGMLSRRFARFALVGLFLLAGLAIAPGLPWPVLAWGLGAALALAGGVYVWTISLRRRVRAVVRDIEAKNRELLENQTALRAREHHFRELIDLAVDGILVGSPEGVIMLANPSMGRILGMAPEAMLGKHIRDFFPPRVLAEKPLRFDLLEQGETVAAEREVLRPDGTLVLLEMHSKKMPDGGYHSFVRDITERRRTEDDLRRKTAELE
ncbi:MAG: PAS domain S-box protein, partial [Lentisphaeria bacterium]|nr:PAS domain S-box protein [Lentisphaeria bacterium]